MFSLRTLLGLCSLASAHALSYNTSKIQWGPCNETELPSEYPIECSRLPVPLDYTRPNASETLVLELVKVPATVKPSKGSILLNFGGPGLPARDDLVGALADRLLALSGRSYDLVAFDPRGTGNTLPTACFEPGYESNEFANDLLLGNQSDVQLGRLWARGTTEAEACLARQNETGSLISTAFVARDLISTVDALGEDGMLRYWGFSYGTTLGATVSAMFPDRIHRMVLDGQQNPHEYYHAQADFQEWTDSDKVFSAIFSGCVAAPSNCALATGNNATAADLEHAVWDLVDTLKYRPLALGSYIVDYSVLKGLLQASLYDSAGWPQLATWLNLLITKQYAVLEDLLTAAFPTDESTVLASLRTVEALRGIHCGDNDVRTEGLEGMMSVVERLYRTSRVMGDAAIGNYFACAQWRIEPRERYTGTFDIKTKNPVLFIGNTFDGHTPLASARNLSATFEGSVVLEVNGYGHSSLAVPSACTIRTTSAYWLDGTLPNEGVVCPSDAPLYSDVTWADVIAKVYGNDTGPGHKRTVPASPVSRSLFGPVLRLRSGESG
ncbi:Uu.00g038530.m01.CDS01 [Anthostomella pinea]|uniref:Uu.00g038530.m01.CDS01 n=1 Tax=Anthostomella pinea TaxID=933095 RepID=A0AAI8YDR0_9PEZI|nr:Uu.00g038530.m01.CDS01 [Anthostomella pinea]